MSKELIARVDRRLTEAHELIEVQQKRIKELEADTQEVNAARIYLREQERLLRQLAAAGADNKRLRNALEAMVMYAKAEGKGLRIADEALALPTDTTALRELLAAERERLKQHLTFAFLLAVGSLDQTDDVSEDIIQFCVELVERQPDEKITAEEKLREIMEAIRAMGSES